MHLPNKSYDILKWLVLVVLPAVAVLSKGLGDLYGFEFTDMIVSTINMFAVFVGTILQISSMKYNGGSGGSKV